MAVPNIRQRLESKLDQLSDEELTAVLRYVEAMQSTSLPDEYDLGRDPAIGFFTADPDFASHTEEILQAGFGRPRQKDDK